MKYKLSGHETFVLRFTWLPKLVIGLQQNEKLLSMPDEAIVNFGVGKNMVSAIKFWGICTNVIENVENRIRLTDFGKYVFVEDGLRPGSGQRAWRVLGNYGSGKSA